MKVAKGLEVKIEFELKVKGGALIESAPADKPLVYPHGDGKMLPALEKVLEGLETGQERSGEIPARDAFGTEESLPTMEMARKSFPAAEKLDIGRTFEGKGPGGGPVTFKIITVKDDHVTVRLLHPLVGRDLTYRVKVLGVDDPAARKLPPALPPGAVEMDLEEIGES